MYIYDIFSVIHAWLSPDIALEPYECFLVESVCRDTVDCQNAYTLAGRHLALCRQRVVVHRMFVVSICFQSPRVPRDLQVFCIVTVSSFLHFVYSPLFMASRRWRPDRCSSWKVDLSVRFSHSLAMSLDDAISSWEQTRNYWLMEQSHGHGACRWTNASHTSLSWLWTIYRIYILHAITTIHIQSFWKLEGTIYWRCCKRHTEAKVTPKPTYWHPGWSRDA